MEHVVKGGKKLRFGYTTGACAAGAAGAAATMLLENKNIPCIRLTTPGGVELVLDVADVLRRPGSVTCAVKKDAGDDPDVTHGLKIYAEVYKTAGGMAVEGGQGVGRVTKPGLKVAPGSAAINPVPLQMITKELQRAAENAGYSGGLKAVISVPGGETVAKKTYNPRLGVEGGISILGTSGIVEPMSEKALVDTIHTQMDVYQKEGRKVLVITPGNYGAGFIKSGLGLHINIDKAVKCSNFIGETLDYACYLDFKKILLVGHTGKLLKVASGVMNTHSSVADGRMEILAAHYAMAGGNPVVVADIMRCLTTEEAIRVMKNEPPDIYQNALATIRDKIADHLNFRTKGASETAFILFHETDSIFIQSLNAVSMAKEAEL